MARMSDTAAECASEGATEVGASSDPPGEYVTVSFDDGPETGLTALTSEDDLCDPRYWRFQEVHGSEPKYKVLFNDGFTSFLTAMPVAEDGVVIDEDGDEHRYVKVNQLPVQERQETNTMRRALGGYGFIEVVEDASASEALEPKTKRPSKAKAAAGDSKRRKTAGSKVDLEVPVKKAAEDLEASANVEGQAVEGARPMPSGVTIAQGSSAVDLGASEPEGSKATKAIDETELRAPEKTEGTGASAKVNVEKAKTGRSVCRTCGGGIDKDSVRCGLQGYAGGRSVLLWAHANCFLGKIQVDYVTARRGRCKGTGEAFEIGQLRVGFEVGNHKSWWLPTEAARWTCEVFRLSGAVMPDLRGIDELEEAHRSGLLELLSEGHGLSNSQLKSSKVPSKSSKTKRAPKPKKDDVAAISAKETAKAEFLDEDEPQLNFQVAATHSVAPAEEDSDVEVTFEESVAIEGRVPLDLDESE